MTLFLVEPSEFLVAVKGPDLTLLQGDPVEPKRVPQRGAVRHALGDCREPARDDPGTTGLPTLMLPLKLALFAQGRLQSGLAVAAAVLNLPVGRLGCCWRP